MHMSMGMGMRMGMTVRMSGEEERRRVRRRMWRRRRHRRTVDVQSRILLFPLGPAILEPDLHLRFRERQRQGEVQAFADGEISGGFELVFKGHQLFVGEGCPGSAGLATCNSAIVLGGLTVPNLTGNSTVGGRGGTRHLALFAVGGGALLGVAEHCRGLLEVRVGHGVHVVHFVVGVVVHLVFAEGVLVLGATAAGVLALGVFVWNLIRFLPMVLVMDRELINLLTSIVVKKLQVTIL